MVLDWFPCSALESSCSLIYKCILTLSSNDRTLSSAIVKLLGKTCLGILKGVDNSPQQELQQECLLLFSTSIISTELIVDGLCYLVVPIFLVLI